MKKILLVVCILLVIIVATLGIVKFLDMNNSEEVIETKFENEKNNLEDCKYYAYVDDMIDGASNTYVFKLWQDGKYKMVVKRTGSAVDAKTTLKEYDGYLTNEEMKKVNEIFSYLANKYENTNKENTDFYLDFAIRRDIDYNDINILTSTLNCIKNSDTQTEEESLIWLDEILNEYK